MNSTAVWFMLIFGVLFIGLKGFEISGVDIAERAPWRDYGGDGGKRT